MAYEMLWSTQSGYLTNTELNLKFQKAAQPRSRFRQFCAIKEAFGKNSGETVNWLKVSNASAYGRTLTETSTIPETTLPLSWGTVSVSEYGLAIPFTFKVEALSKFDVEQLVKGALLDDCVKVIDGIVEREFNKTPLRYVGTATDGGALTTNSTATASNTSALNLYHLREMITYLKARNVPGYSTLDGDYVLIGSPTTIKGLLADMTTVAQYTEKMTGQVILNGEIGRVYGCRIIEDTFASYNVFTASTGSASAISWGQSKSLPAYLFGSPTVREAVAVPEEIRVKVPTDYGRSKGIAWYGIFGWGLEWGTEADSRIIKWDSAG